MDFRFEAYHLVLSGNVGRCPASRKDTGPRGEPFIVHMHTKTEVA